MKRTIMIILLLMTAVISFAYYHVYAYQDFSDFNDGDLINDAYIPSNDDGSHGINDRWGDKNQYTWPDVPGDTNFYLDSGKPLSIKEIEDENALHFRSDGTEKLNLGLSHVTLPVGMMLEVKYQFYIDKKETPEAAFVFLSTDLPGKEGRIAVVFEDGKVKVIRTINRYRKIVEYEVEYKAYNEWKEFSFTLWYRKEFRIAINNKYLYTYKSIQPYPEFPFLSIGNTIDEGENAITDTYIKKLVIYHFI